MGLYNSITKATSRSGAATTYDGHSVTAPDVLNGSADGIRPDSNIQWTVDTPTTIHAPTTATLEQAETEELQAIEYSNNVQNGIRLMKARAKKVKDNVKLVVAHRGYLGTVVNATVAIAGANKGLADKMQNARAAFAGMGHSLDQKTQTIDHRVETIKAKFQQRRG